jgi:hypothetical protein
MDQDVSPRTALPDTDQISGGISERRDPQVPLRIRLRHNLPALNDHRLQRRIDPLDEDVGQDAGVPSNREIGHEVPDDMAGPVLETRIITICVHAPTEHSLIERRRPPRLPRRNPQIRDPALPEDARLFSSTSSHNAIIETQE